MLLVTYVTGAGMPNLLLKNRLSRVRIGRLMK